MRTRALLAALLAATFLSTATGCSGMRSRERGLREPVQLPAAPKLEATPPGSLTPTSPSAVSPGSQAISPLSATAPAEFGQRR